MSEEEVSGWMKGLDGAVDAGSLPDAEKIWIRALLDARFEPRRRAAASMFWLDAAVHSALGLALAVVSLWLIGR